MLNEKMSDAVYRRTNDLIKHETLDKKIPKQVKSIATCHKNSRTKRSSRIYQMPGNHSVRHIAFAPPPQEYKNLVLPWAPPNRRAARPWFQWVTETLNDMWTKRASITLYMDSIFDTEGNEQQHMTIQSEMTSPRPSLLFKGWIANQGVKLSSTQT